MPKAATMREAASFSTSSLIELYTLDGTAIGLDEVYRFCNASSANYRPIVFNGVTYNPFPILMENMDTDGKGSQTRPKLTVSNINGFVSQLLLGNGGLDGATITRKRVYARFIDAVNFPANEPLPSWVTPDPTNAYSDEPWQVNRKVMENPQVVVFELASPYDAQRAQLPKRQILANTCFWKYRQARTCNYSGAPVADAANRTFTGSFYNMVLSDQGAYSNAATYDRGHYVTTYSTLPQFADIPFVWVCTIDGTVGIPPSASSPNWVADACPKSSAACSMRHTVLRTSAYPGVSRSGFIGR